MQEHRTEADAQIKWCLEWDVEHKDVYCHQREELWFEIEKTELSLLLYKIPNVVMHAMQGAFHSRPTRTIRVFTSNNRLNPAACSGAASGLRALM